MILIITEAEIIMDKISFLYIYAVYMKDYA